MPVKLTEWLDLFIGLLLVKCFMAKFNRLRLSVACFLGKIFITCYSLCCFNPIFNGVKYNLLFYVHDSFARSTSKLTKSNHHRRQQ